MNIKQLIKLYQQSTIKFIPFAQLQFTILIEVKHLIRDESLKV